MGSTSREMEEIDAKRRDEMQEGRKGVPSERKESMDGLVGMQGGDGSFLLDMMQRMERENSYPCSTSNEAILTMERLGRCFEGHSTYPKQLERAENCERLAFGMARMMRADMEYNESLRLLYEKFFCFLSLPEEDFPQSTGAPSWERTLRRSLPLLQAFATETTRKFRFQEHEKLRSFVVLISSHVVHPNGIAGLILSLCGVSSALDAVQSLTMEGAPLARILGYIVWRRIKSIARTCPLHVATRDVVSESLSLGLSCLGPPMMKDEVFADVLVKALFFGAFSLSDVLLCKSEHISRALTQAHHGVLVEHSKSVLHTLAQQLSYVSRPLLAAILGDLVNASKRLHHQYQEILLIVNQTDARRLEGGDLRSILARAYLCYTFIYHSVLSLPGNTEQIACVSVLESLSYLDFCRVQSDMLLSVLTTCVATAIADPHVGCSMAKSRAVPNPSSQAHDWEIFSRRILEDKLFQSLFLFHMRFLPLIVGALPAHLLQNQLIPMALCFLSHPDPLLCHAASLLFLGILLEHSNAKKEYVVQCVPSYTRLVLAAYPSPLAVGALEEVLSVFLHAFSGEGYPVRCLVEDLIHLATKLCSEDKESRSGRQLISLLFQAIGAIGLRHLEWFLGSLQILLLGPAFHELDTELLLELRSVITLCYDYNRKPTCVKWYQDLFPKARKEIGMHAQKRG